jgi:hypothetical protein
MSLHHHYGTSMPFKREVTIPLVHDDLSVTPNTQLSGVDAEAQNVIHTLTAGASSEGMK